MLATALLLGAACHEQKAAEAIDLARLQGKPTCVASYQLKGAADVLSRHHVQIADSIHELGRAYLEQTTPSAGNAGDIEIAAFVFGTTGLEPSELEVTFMKPCETIGDTSDRLLALIDAGNSAFKLPDGVYLEFVSSTEEPFSSTAPGPLGKPQ